MIINVTTFELLLRKRGLTQAALADRARLGTKTVGRIRRGEELRPANAEKIAKALNVTLEVLQSPPTDKLEDEAGKKSGLHRLVADINGQPMNALTLASLRYNISEQTILEVAPYMFMILAELSLKRRRDSLEAWKDAALASVEQGPRRERPTIEEITDPIWDLYHHELASIETRDLSGGFSGTHPEEPKPENPDHPFLAMLELLAAECGHELKFVDATVDCFIPFSYEALNEAIDEFLDPEDEYSYFWPDEDGCFLIEAGQILLRQMPEDLLASGTGAARRAWVSNHPNYSSFLEPASDDAPQASVDQLSVAADSGGSDA